MKYFNPSYWFKLWVLSAPLFNDKTQGINAKSIDKEKIKDWASNNTDLQSINQELNLTNNTISNSTNIDIDHFYENFLKTQGWSKDPQIAQQQLIEIQEEHHHFLEAQHEKRRSIHKRELNGENEIEYWSWPYYKLYVLLTPKFLEEIIFINNSIIFTNPNNYLSADDEKYPEINEYNNQIAKKLETCSPIDHRVIGDFDYLKTVGDGIRWYMSKINDVWQNSNKKERIRLEFKSDWFRGSMKPRAWKLISANIISEDTKYYENPYLENLNRDFPDYNKDKVNLGIISDNFEIEIIYAIKKKYPNFDINHLSIVDKTDYSHLCQCFLAKPYLHGNSFKYSYGSLKVKFSYVTQTKINEISNIIANDKDIKKWINDINDWNSTLSQAIENAKTFTPEALYNWKRNEKETIKNYLARWDTTVRIINNELKLDELNKNVQGLKSSFDMIKNQVNELDTKITNLENQSNANCANSATISAGVISVIPVIGNVGGAIATVTAGACAIAGV